MQTRNWATLFHPSWPALQLLSLAGLSVCIIVALTSTWGSELTAYVPLGVPELPQLELAFPRLTGVSLGIVKGDGSDFGAGSKDGKHPIDQLIADAEKEFALVTKSEAKSLNDAAVKYRQRRGRHPPPGFDAWYEFAAASGSIIVEEFWDQIYDDLGPFWGVSPHTLRQQAHALSPRISIREGKVASETKNPHKKLEQWRDMLASVAAQKHITLPDVDLPINMNAEPALAVPWEIIDTSRSLSRPMKPAVKEVSTSFSGLEDLEANNATFDFEPEWLGPRRTHPASTMGPRPYWTVVQPACSPSSPSRAENIMTDIWHADGHTSDAHSAVNILPMQWPNRTMLGFVKNWTTATDVCQYSYLQGLHGAFVAPEDMSVSQKLFPLLSGAGKLSVNNEILIPGASEWNQSDEYASRGEDIATKWEDKDYRLFWRGEASGGRYKESNWPRFHRHRFVSMLNASHIRLAERTSISNDGASTAHLPIQTFQIPSTNPYHLSALHNGKLADWVEGWADVSFTTGHLHCDYPAMDGSCPPYSNYFATANAITEADQNKYKYTALLDGNGGDDGGEFIRNLHNGIVTLRATVYRKWYDARLKPWIHFVPMDNTFIDVWAIMEYFLGRPARIPKPENGKRDNIHDIDGDAPKLVQGFASGDSAHDKQARRMAVKGKEWAEKVLRKEDMLIYMHRLVLEYARLVDDSRERLGWVRDLDVEGGRQ